MSLVGNWKSLIILKEIKKHSSKFLQILAKTQLRFEIFEKNLKFTYKNLNGKLIFYPFSLPSSRTNGKQDVSNVGLGGGSGAV